MAGPWPGTRARAVLVWFSTLIDGFIGYSLSDRPGGPAGGQMPSTNRPGLNTRPGSSLSLTARMSARSGVDRPHTGRTAFQADGQRTITTFPPAAAAAVP